jgi:hypothetical protein
MKKYIFALFLLLCCAVPSKAQFTTVSATVKDSNGNIYQACHGEADFVPSPNATTQPFLSGSLFQTSVIINQCDGGGNFQIVLADNNQVSDGHGGGMVSQWRFTICSSGTPPICFVYTTTITGATQNITAGLSSVAPILPFPPASLLANNIWTGTNTFNGLTLILGGGTLTGSFSGTPVFSSLTDSGLTSGNCVQATSGGLLTTVSGPCGTSTGTLTATGSPVSGNLAKFSGGTSLTNTDLTGDVTTSGTSAATLSTTIGSPHTWSGLGTFSAGITGTGNIGSLGLGSTSLGANNAWSGTAQFTGTAPTFSVTTGGSDSNSCLVASPCLTVQHAAIVAMQYMTAGFDVTVNIGTGSFAGVNIAGVLMGSGVQSTQGSFLILNGNGAANTTITQWASSGINIQATSGIMVQPQNMTISVATGQFGLFSELFSNITTGVGVTIIGTGTATAMHSEADSYMANGASVTLTGSFGSIYTGSTNSIAQFGNALVCSSLTSVTQWVYMDTSASVSFSSISGCGGVTGTRYVVNGNAFVNNLTGSALPGNAIGQVASGGRYRPSPVISTPTSTGLGTGSAAFAASYTSGSHGGVITLSPTGSPSATGTIGLNWAEDQISSSSTFAPCTVALIAGTSQWPTTSILQINVLSLASLSINWATGGAALTAGQTYNVSYTCTQDN